MRKEEVYSFILYYMKRIEKSRENKVTKLNKILILTIYYNIFEYEYGKFMTDIEYGEEKIDEFIEYFNLEESNLDSEIYITDELNEKDDLNKDTEFKKVEENNILKYAEVKESIKEIEEEKEAVEAIKAELKKDDEKEEEVIINKDTEFKKVEENNILKYAEVKESIKEIEEAKEAVEAIKAELEKDNEKKEEVIINEDTEFKKVEENNILKYAEVKESIKEIEEEKKAVEAIKAELKKDNEKEEEAIINKDTEFKKVEENNILKYVEVKESIKEIEEEKEAAEAIKAEREEDNEKEEEAIINEDTEFKKVEENNILKYAEVKESIEDIKKNYTEKKDESIKDIFHKVHEKNINDNIQAKEEIEKIKSYTKTVNKYCEKKRHEYQHITNDVKVILETKGNMINLSDKEIKESKYVKEDDIKKYKIKDSVKRKVPVEIGNVTINEMLYGRVKFSRPILGISDIKNIIIMKNLDIVKGSSSDIEEKVNLIYDGFVRTDIEYLEDINICCRNINAISKHYLMYIPFNGVKKVNINDEDFKKEKYLNHKISFDMKSSESESHTSLKEEKCIGPYVKVYGECEVFIILECIINILMKKLI